MLLPEPTMPWPVGWVLDTVADPEDPRLHPFRDLTDMDLRRRIEPERGFFIAEGRLVIERVARAGHAIDAVLTAPRWLPVLAEDLPYYAGPVLVASREVIDAIAGYRVHRGALAVVRRPRARDVPEVADAPGHLVLLEDLVDPTNVGLAFRSAAALGIAGIVLSPRCADPLYRRAVKTSMGAVLDLPWARSGDWATDLSRMRGFGVSVIALTPHPEAEDLEAALAARECARVALLVGTEGEGLSAGALGASERLARIPMSGGIDSLNVAAAVAVACYALTR
ncbi:MAG: TrmH family RNA methyltransferase [bacterium]